MLDNLIQLYFLNKTNYLISEEKDIFYTSILPHSVLQRISGPLPIIATYWAITICQQLAIDTTDTHSPTGI